MNSLFAAARSRLKSPGTTLRSPWSLTLCWCTPLIWEETRPTKNSWDRSLDSADNTYVVGLTNSPDFPTANPLQAGNHTAYPKSNAFVTKINVAGSALVYSTYLGGSNSDDGLGIAVDVSGNAYVTGSTSPQVIS